MRRFLLRLWGWWMKRHLRRSMSAIRHSMDRYATERIAAMDLDVLLANAREDRRRAGL